MPAVELRSQNMNGVGENIGMDMDIELGLNRKVIEDLSEGLCVAMRMNRCERRKEEKKRREETEDQYIW